jgi:hypothetical protein
MSVARWLLQQQSDKEELMEGVRRDRRLWHLGVLAVAVGFVLSGVGIAFSVACLPFGILILLFGAVLVVIDSAKETVA